MNYDTEPFINYRYLRNIDKWHTDWLDAHFEEPPRMPVWEDPNAIYPYDTKGCYKKIQLYAPKCLPHWYGLMIND